MVASNAYLQQALVKLANLARFSTPGALKCLVCCIIFTTVEKLYTLLSDFGQWAVAIGHDLILPAFVNLIPSVMAFRHGARN